MMWNAMLEDKDQPPPAQKLKEKHAHQRNVQMFSEPSGENY
jgi:hypothetical protein